MKNSICWHYTCLGNIDDDGYLRRRLENIVDDVAFALNIETDEAELIGILRIIQELDPPGIGARNLQECLLLQIEAKDIGIPFAGTCTPDSEGFLC